MSSDDRRKEAAERKGAADSAWNSRRRTQERHEERLKKTRAWFETTDKTDADKAQLKKVEDMIAKEWREDDNDNQGWIDLAEKGPYRKMVKELQSFMGKDEEGQEDQLLEEQTKKRADIPNTKEGRAKRKKLLRAAARKFKKENPNYKKPSTNYTYDKDK